jgi:hypothetical protein
VSSTLAGDNQEVVQTQAPMASRSTSEVENRAKCGTSLRTQGGWELQSRQRLPPLSPCLLCSGGKAHACSGGVSNSPLRRSPDSGVHVTGDFLGRDFEPAPPTSALVTPVGVACVAPKQTHPGQRSRRHEDCDDLVSYPRTCPAQRACLPHLMSLAAAGHRQNHHLPPGDRGDRQPIDGQSTAPTPTARKYPCGSPCLDPTGKSGLHILRHERQL